MTFFDVFFFFMDSVKYQRQASMNHLFRIRDANKVPAPPHHKSGRSADQDEHPDRVKGAA